MGTLTIGDYEIKVVKKIEQKRKEYKAVDKDGNEITTEYTPATKILKNKDGTIIEKTYKLINGKVFDKLKKTDKAKYEEVDKIETYDLIVECYYFCKCEKLRKHLAEKDKALKLTYTNGNGFKAYQSYIMPFGKHLILVCGFGSLTENISRIATESENEKEEESNDGVERINPEELLLA